VATPAYDGKVDSDYAQSLADSSFCAPLYMVQVSHSVIGNGAFIELSRNIFVKMFLEDHKEATHLFFIDGDIKFPANAFIGLIRSGHPICAGVYRRREDNETYPARWTPHPTLGGLWVEDDWIMHDRVPTGFLCISRKVVEEMAADAPIVDLADRKGIPWLFHTYRDGNRFIGEDYSFCDDYVKKYGKPIPVWPDIDLVHGGYKGNYLEWIKERAEPLTDKPDDPGSGSEMSDAA
jgi:hypothetical protein